MLWLPLFCTSSILYIVSTILSQCPTVTEAQTTTISSPTSPNFSIAIPLGAIIPPSCKSNLTSPYGNTCATWSKSKSCWYFGGTANNTSSFNLSYPPFGISRWMDGMELNSMEFLQARMAAFVDDWPCESFPAMFRILMYMHYINKYTQNHYLDKMIRLVISCTHQSPAQ